MFLLLRSSSFEHVRPGHNVSAKVGHHSMGSLGHPDTIGQCCWWISVRVTTSCPFFLDEYLEKSLETWSGTLLEPALVQLIRAFMRSPTPNTVHPYVSAEDSCFFCSSLTYSCGGFRRFHFTDDFTCFPYSWHNWFRDFFVTSHQFLNLSQMIFTIVGREPWDGYVSWMPSKIVFLLTSIGAFLLPSIGALTTMPTCQTHCFSFGSSLLCFDKLKCSSASKKSVRNKLFQLCIVRSFCSEGWEALFVIRTNLLSIASINCHLSLICDLILNFAAVLEHHCVKFTKFSE